MNLNLLLIGFLSWTAVSCRDESERPETVDKLRALGVEQSPINAKPGDVVQLTYYLASLPSQQISAQVMVDDKARYGLSLPVTLVDSTPKETNIGALSIYSLRATLSIPNNSSISAAIMKVGSARVRYNVKFSSENENENIVGDTIVYPDGAPQLDAKPLAISIVKPDASSAAGTIALESSIEPAGVGGNRVSWFVSAGQVNVRRAKNTEWQKVPPGNQSLILTARNSKSGAFAIKSMTVKVE